MKRASVTSKLIRAFNTGKSFTSAQLRQKSGSTNLTAHIYHLRHNHELPIVAQMKNGKTYYRLAA